MSTPSPKSPEPSEKNKKYDRQLRLWGDHGQICLENARVCLINATTVGTEILKSLVLAGVGSFTIIDGNLVKEEDLGCNFFLEIENINESRAKATTTLLSELNSDVRGDYVDSSIDQILNQSPEFFDSFNIVIATNVSEKTLLVLSKQLWTKDIPLIVCKSIGFLGYCRVQVREHTIIESHPDNVIPDLRLDKPFCGLVDFMNKIDLDSMALKEHSHTPYLVILYKYLEHWSKSNGKSLPENFKEKQALKQLITNGIRKDEYGVALDEENFEEAIRAINTVISKTSISANVNSIFRDDCCLNLTQKSKPFWILARALKDFVENEGNGCLPLRGTIPDMTADTNSYIALQQIYRKQAADDTEAVYRRVQQILHDLGQASDTIGEKDVRWFCRHAHDINLTRGTCIADEYLTKANTSNYICNEFENSDSMMIYYVMIRGLDRFYNQYNMYPGEFDDQVEPDIIKLKGCISKLLNEWSCQSQSKDDYVHEICRYGGAELHSVSSFLGGCVAHEVIKFVTNQYKPVNNTFIYNAISSMTTTFAL